MEEEKKRSNQSLEVDFSYHVRRPLSSTPRPHPMLSSKYLWRSSKFEQIFAVVTWPLLFWSEVRTSSADPDVVIQAEHLESLSQTASPCDVVS